MSDTHAQVSVRILDKEYQVACPASERTDLLDCAEVLNEKMREIRDSGRIVGLDRIAVMAALNMANDLLHAQERDKALEGNVSDRLKIISDRVDSVLGNTQQLDLSRRAYEFDVSCSVRYRPGYLSTLNFYLGVVHCRQHVCRTDLSESLLLPRLTPPVAPVRERRFGNGSGGRRHPFYVPRACNTSMKQSHDKSFD